MASAAAVQNPFDFEVSLFSGTGAKLRGKAAVWTVLDNILCGKFKDKILRLREIKKTDEKRYKAEKKTLTSATLAGYFSYRDLENMVRPSGFFSGDIDHIDDLARVRASVCQDPLTAFCFASPGGDGLKIGVKISTKNLDNAKYHDVFSQVQKHYQEKHGVSLDETRKDITGLCFLSYDPETFINTDSEILPDPVVVPPLPPLPEALREPLPEPSDDAKRRYCRDALSKACEAIRSAADGTRNHTLNKQSYVVGGMVAAGGLDRVEAEAALREAGEVAGLSSAEVSATIGSGFTKGVKAPLDLSKLITSPSDFFSNLVGESLNPGEWQKVICFLEKITLPKFPSECLPAAMRAYVESVAECRQVPVDLPAFLAIAVAAAAGARKYRVYIGESHDEPLNIWTVSALPPGSRKTDTYEDMAEPLRIEQSRLSAIMKPAIDSAKAFQKIREKRMEHLLSQAAKEENQAKRDKLSQEYTDLGQSAAKVPSYPQLLVGGDTTPEAIAGILEDQGGKIAIMDTEGGLFSIISGRYDSKGESNLDVWLKLHAGDDLLINRKNKPPIEVSKPAGTIALTVQPGVIKDLAGKKEFNDRGLLGRFLYSIPESLIGTRLYQNKRADPTAKAAYLDAIRNIFSQPNQWSTSDNDRAPHYELFIRGNTLAIWTKFCNDIEKRQAAGGDLAGIKDWASKSASAIARIAGIFHIVETGGDPDNDEIPAETMRMACEIGNRYLIDHTKAAYGLMSMTADTHLARGILTWVAAKGKDTFTATDFWADNRSKAERVDELLPGFEALVDRGILRELPGTTTGGRRAKYRYEVNPTCKSCFRCMRSAGE
jgi:hypothetical protein